MNIWKSEWIAHTSEQFALRLDDRRRTDRFVEPNSTNYACCPHCNRATQLIEHAPTAQLMLDPERQRDELYFTCEWCNAEIPGPKEQAARKLVETRVAEDETEWARRIA